MCGHHTRAPADAGARIGAGDGTAAYSNAPVGLNFLVAGFSYVEGGIATDPAGPIENAELAVWGPVLGYARTLDVAGRSAKVDVIVPYGFLSGTADVAGQPHDREVSGFWDPKLRFSMSFFGAPALTAQEFARYRQDWIMGMSVQVGLPLGQYDDERVVNLGSHRWSIKPELGVSKALGPWTLELAAGGTFYTDNDDYFGDQTREQEPVYSAQGHLVYTFASRIWFGVDATYHEGGATTIDGAQSSDRLRSSRLGLTLSLPVNAQSSIKLFAHSGVSVRTGTDFDAIGAAWQYRWGGRAEVDPPLTYSGRTISVIGPVDSVSPGSRRHASREGSTVTMTSTSGCPR